MRATLLLVPIFCVLPGSLALPQAVTGSSVSLPGVDLSPADQTACIQSCSLSVARNRPDALNACLDATGRPAPECLCTDGTLATEMHRCFAARCPPLLGHCGAILGGSNFAAGTTVSAPGSAGAPGQTVSAPGSAGSPGQTVSVPGQSGSSSSGSVSFPDVQLPPEQQSDCIQSCSADVSQRKPDALDACLDAPGATATKCLCTDTTLASEMQRCFADRCAPLQGRCGAILDGSTFVGDITASTGSTTPGTVVGPSTGGSASVSFPDVALPAAQQSDCIQSCSADVAQRKADALDACLSVPGATATKCLCTDTTLASDMQRCFADRCAPLQGHCGAIIGGSSFAAGTTTTTSSGGTSSQGGSSSSPGSSGSGSPGSAGAQGSSGSSQGGSSASSGTSGSGTPAPGLTDGTSTNGNGPSTPSPAAPAAVTGGPDSSARSDGAVPLALALGIVFALL